MVKSTQTIGVYIPKTALYGATPISSIDVSKSTVLLNGSSVNIQVVDDVQVPVTTGAYVYELTSDNIKVAWSIRELNGVYTETAYVSVTIIEYI